MPAAALFPLNTNFFHQGIWWTLLSLLLLHTAFQCIGFHLGLLTSLPRKTFGWQYENALWVRALLGAVMLLSTHVYSVLAALAITVSLMFLFFPAARTIACEIIMKYAGRDASELTAHLEWYFRRIINEKAASDNPFNL